MMINGVEGLVRLGLCALFGAAVLAGAANFPYRDPAGARDVLENEAALKNVQIQEGRAWFTGCGRGYVYKTKFNAVNANGQEVKGVVCGPLWGNNSAIKYKK